MPAALSGWSRAALTSLSAKPPPEKINRGPNHKDENQWLPHDRACPLKRAAEISGAGSRRSPGPPETESVGLSGAQVGGFADPVSRSLTKRKAGWRRRTAASTSSTVRRAATVCQTLGQTRGVEINGCCLLSGGFWFLEGLGVWTLNLA